jgi:hypothetical protein
MSLRIAWACHPRNIGLGIAANVFVYVGTIILFMINWFFVQRIVRAQHQRLGWSTAYRIFHRGALVVLVITLIMIIVSSIWQFFTINETKLHAFRALQLTGQTYFTIFCIAPAILVLISCLLPRREIEKFGAGRLRVNITILLAAVTILTTGQLFRCVIAWIPQTPVRDASGQPTDAPGYLSKGCFYVFNFVTEIMVVVMFAIVRVDLRFHVPDGSRISGDYSGRNSRVNLNSRSNVNVNNKNSQAHLRDMANEKQNSCEAPIIPMTHRNGSTETVHKYETSVFEDSHTLADSLKYGASTLEVDGKTGAYKVKRSSIGSVSSTHGSSFSSQCDTPVNSTDRTVKFLDEAPPVPEVPARLSTPVAPNRRGTPKRTFEIAGHGLNDVDVGGAVTDALAALEHNSTMTQEHPRISTTPQEINRSTTMSNDTYHRASRNPLAPRKRATFPPKSALKMPRAHNSISTTASQAKSIPETPESPEQPKPTASRHTRRSSSIEIISLAQNPALDPRKVLDVSLQGEVASDISRPDSAWDTSAVDTPSSVSVAIGQDMSMSHNNGTANTDAGSRAAPSAETEASRFSFDSFPAVPGSSRAN